MFAESDKTTKEKNSKQSSKSNNEPIKPNLRDRSSIVNNYNYKVTIPKRNFSKPTISLNKDKTPIKLKQSDELMKKMPSEFIFDEMQLTETRKEKANFLIKDESPWTKFCKSDLSPLCKNNLLSPNKPATQENDSLSQAKMTNRLIEYQTPSPSLLKKAEFLDFSPFLNYTAKKVIQKLDFSNLDEKKNKNQSATTNSVIVCFKSPTFNFLNKKYELEEDFIFSSHPKASLEKAESSSDPGEDDIIKLISKGPQIKENPSTNDTKQKHKSFLKTMNKYKDVDLEGNIPTIKKTTPFVTTNEPKPSHEELNPKNLSLHSFYSMPKGNVNYTTSKTGFRTSNADAETGDNYVKNNEKKIEGNEENTNQELQESFQIPKKILCNCKKSRCLKLYCDCFAASEFCSKDCNCLNCANVVENEEERYSSMMALMERNPLAFKPKYDKKEEIEEKNLLSLESTDKIRHAKGCNCKKSNCLKKYCECYQAGIKCTDLCKCDTCKNHDGVGFLKKRKGNPLVENFNQYSENKQEIGPNSFTFGYNHVYDENDRKEKRIEGFEEEGSNGSNHSFRYAKNFKTQDGTGGFYRTPKMKYENINIKKEKIKL